MTDAPGGAPGAERIAPRSPAVKFCGLVRAEDAATAARLGAAHVGSIFAGGPRAVTAAVARRNARAARDAAAPGARPASVGVFGGQPLDVVLELAEAAELDAVQLHADPDADAVTALRAHWRGESWAVLRVPGSALPGHAAELFAVADAVVLDARVAGGPLGGTGTTLPWAALADAVAAVRGATRLVLAGGLTPENVAAAAAALAPDVVDVSSGVERAPGVKDPARMAALVAALAPRPTPDR